MTIRLQTKGGNPVRVFEREDDFIYGVYWVDTEINGNKLQEWIPHKWTKYGVWDTRTNQPCALDLDYINTNEETIQEE